MHNFTLAGFKPKNYIIISLEQLILMASSDSWANVCARNDKCSTSVEWSLKTTFVLSVSGWRQQGASGHLPPARRLGQNTGQRLVRAAPQPRRQLCLPQCRAPGRDISYRLLHGTRYPQMEPRNLPQYPVGEYRCQCGAFGWTCFHELWYSSINLIKT